jgi:CheY-like chemotaxis protein
MKILAVDDEPMVLNILQTSLSRIGFNDFVGVTSAREALALIAKQDFDCFLLDIRMPVMNGIELTKAIRQTRKHADTPIVMITSHSELPVIDQAFAEGATDYITKPLDWIEFNSRIRNVKRLVNERKRVAALEAQAFGKKRKSFEEPRYFADVGTMREYLAFENYVLTLSRKRLFMFSFLAIHVTNAANLYTEVDEQEYDEILQDVSLSLFDAMQSHHAVFAHAGGGDFIAAFNRFDHVDPESVLEKARFALAEYDFLYGLDGIQAPHLVAGDCVSPSFFSASKPGMLLERALGKPLYVENTETLKVVGSF